MRRRFRAPPRLSTTMRRTSGLLLALGLLGMLPACGGSTSAGVVTRAGNFRLALCSLGCGGGTCAVNQIATNQDIVFTFNDDVDPATVSFSTISVVEVANGSTPPGEFLVSGRKVIFRPQLIENEAGIQFGFDEGANYRVTLLASPESSVVRSVIGRPNLTPISCVVSTSGIIDLVPGRPRVEITPNGDDPPTTSEFDIVMVFNDLMQKDQLVDPVTGDSPSVSVSVVDDSQPSGTVVVKVPGTFSVEFDQNALLTTLRFHPLAPFPGGMGGLRNLRVDFSSQIADIANNFLANPGANLVPLPDRTSQNGSFVESFDDGLMEDPDGSTAGLWNGVAGAVDSGYDPVAGVHKGGGSGILGVFEPSEDFVFSTDSQDMVTITGETVTITDGVFMFERIHIPAGVTVSATGSKPLRLYSRGACVIEGVLDLSGAAAPANFGKYFPRFDERLDDPVTGTSESTGGVFEFEAQGGEPGAGNCSGGAGGRGGKAWYVLDGVRDPGEPPGEPDYYDENLTSWVEGQVDPVNNPPDPNRFLAAALPTTGRWISVHGRPGQGVGAAPTGGDPELNYAQLAGERALGAGMGSWAWPPLTDAIPDAGFTTLTPIKSHFDSVSGTWEHYARHRARGGGGGGYWTEGEQGNAFVAGSVDPLLNLLPAPVNDPANGIWEFNDFLDLDAHGGGGTPDAAGGAYTLPPGIETLDPDQGLLLGGAGGGGAGCSRHGSYHDGGFRPDGLIDTFRDCDGAGGGAGGGALQIQAGGRFSLSGLVTVEGGAGGDSEFMLQLPYTDPAAILLGPPGDAGGGGGSGGAILLQTSGTLTVAPDAFRLDGGRGGKGSAGNHGGAGGAGVMRFETPTGSESLATLQGMVSPDVSVDLAPIGSPGQPNVAVLQASMPGPTGDVGVFNGNASGVVSSWFAPTNDILLLDFTGYRIQVRYDNGTGPQTITYDGDDLSPEPSTTPGTTPIWVAFQVGWGPPGASEPIAETIGDWVVPGYGTTLGGMPELRSNLARMVRFQIVFDHDQIAALIGSSPGAFFRVEEVSLDWVGE
ncbi:MAG: hypothetical protein D6702_09630 [Planctomycetota bacterium]|nr:MAG: hypothetical protein D6702_09630 [Planctomycetota bacterium]